MAGYGYYDEETSGTGLLTGGEGGLMTGAGARAKHRFLFGPPEPTGKIGITRTGKRVAIRRPVRVGMHIEYASKKLFNRQLQAQNQWLKKANEDKVLKELREKVGERMRQLAAEYRADLKKTNPQKFARLEAARAKRKTKAQKYKEAEDVIAKFKAAFPTIKDALASEQVRGLNRKAKQIILRVVYGVPKDDLDRYLPPRPRFVKVIETEAKPKPPPPTTTEEEITTTAPTETTRK
jgi:hypothetical protein